MNCARAEVWAAGLAAVAGGVATAATTSLMSGGGGAGQGGAGLPTYNYNFNPISAPTFNPAQGAIDLNSMFGDLAKYAGAATNYQTKQREKIMPGAANQFRLASKDLQSLLSGEVPQDAVDATNRIVAERTGGAFNSRTGGGSTNQAFARSIGQLSTDLIRQGLSAAPTWNQLANSFVTSTNDAAQLANQINNTRYQYDVLKTNVDQFNATKGMQNYENAYMGQSNQVLGQQNAANQQAALQLQGAGMGVNALTSLYGMYSAGQPQTRTPQQPYNYTGQVYNLSNGSPYTGSFASNYSTMNLPSYAQARAAVYK